MKAGKKQRQERHKLDQILRVLFRLSKRMTVQLINGLFDEQFAPEEVLSIHYSNSEFVTEEYKRMVGDIFIRLETTRGHYHYHVELQTLNDQSMVIRMFRYGFEKALEMSVNDQAAADPKSKELPQLVFPSQTIIYLEENAAINDKLAMRLQLPDGIEMIYNIPVLRYWKLSLQELQERKLYALLPLQVFSSRKAMQRIAASEDSDEKKRRLLAGEFAQLKQTVSRTIAAIGELESYDQLSLGDMDRMLRAIDSILNYLYRHYGEPFAQAEQEVRAMIKSFIDPEVLRKGKEEGKKAGRIEGKIEGKIEGRREGKHEGKLEGKIEGKLEVARNMLELGFDIAMIGRATGLTPEEIDKARLQGS